MKEGEIVCELDATALVERRIQQTSTVAMPRPRTLAFVPAVRGSEPRTVRVGRYNELWVQGLEGLVEGESVLLQAPAGFVTTPPEAQAEGGASGAARAGGS